MDRAFAARFPFLLAVALIAAALADPVVESISNAGIFGGHYADDNRLSIVPTLLVGTALMLEIVTRRCFELLHQPRGDARDWLVDAAREISRRAPLRDAPIVLAMQLSALFLMESTEQLALGGKFLGGMAWLGGPIAFSLLVHALFGVWCIFALGAVMRAIVRNAASLVRSALRFIWLALARVDAGCVRLVERERSYLRAQSPHVRHIGGRAPPLLATLF